VREGGRVPRPLDMPCRGLHGQPPHGRDDVRNGARRLSPPARVQGGRVRCRRRRGGRDRMRCRPGRVPSRAPVRLRHVWRAWECQGWHQVRSGPRRLPRRPDLPRRRLPEARGRGGRGGAEGRRRPRALLRGKRRGDHHQRELRGVRVDVRRRPDVRADGRRVSVHRLHGGQPVPLELLLDGPSPQPLLSEQLLGRVPGECLPGRFALCHRDCRLLHVLTGRSRSGRDDEPSEGPSVESRLRERAELRARGGP